MSDSKRLYFIPIIDGALGSKNPESALIKAFIRIRELGMNPDYNKGFAQFRIFIEKIVKAYVKAFPDRERLIREDIHGLINDLVTNSYEGPGGDKEALIEAFCNNDKWRAEYEHIKSELEDFLAPVPPLAIEVLKDGQMITSLPIPEMPVNLMNIDPGQYTIRLSNGRILWEGILLKKHLLWLEAYGDEDLPMAAKTETDTPQPTLSELLMGGDLIMDVVPDLQSGEIRFSHGKQRR
jgi:hypothetical protein